MSFFFNRANLTEHVYVPIKLIVTSDPEVTNQVSQGTNRQTEVKIEALQSLAPFHKTLEEFYQAASRDRTHKLYYERRSKQYEHLGIAKKDIITLAVQTQCFVAMFLNEPHSTHRYYGELLKSYEDRMFGESHLPIPYFAAGLALVTVERLFARAELERDLRPFRFHLLMIIRLLIDKEALPALNSRKMDAYCGRIISALDDETEARRVFARAADIVREVLQKTPRGREARQRTRAFTSALIEACGIKWPVRNADVERQRGRIKWFSDVKGYGFIESEAGEDVFVHYSGIAAAGYRMPQADERVEFATVETPKGLHALNVRFVN
jgi:cold shock CspA family protein